MTHDYTNNFTESKPGFKIINRRPGLRTRDMLEFAHVHAPGTFAAPLEILFEISTICNMSCLHCYNESCPEGTDFNELLFECLVNEIIDMQPLRCCFSGGEPFIYSGKILPAALKMRKSGILTSVVTNGWFITSDIVPMISRSFVGIQVSIDGATKRIHDKLRNKEGSFERALDAIHLLSGNVKHLQAAHAATSINYMQFPDLVSLLFDKGITHVVVQPLTMQGRARLNPDLYLTDEMLHELVELVAKARLTYGDKLEIDFVEPVQAVKRNILYNKAPNQQMYISAGGYVASNPFIPVFTGNCNDKHLYEIWRDSLERYYLREDVMSFLLDEGIL